MAVSPASPLLSGDFVNGVVDYKGPPVTRSKTGGWSSSIYLIGVEIAERLAFIGVSSNMITYLTGPLHQSTATAAENVNVWYGVACMLPLLGAFVADSYLGRYRTILVGSLVYILGLGMLTISAVLPSLRPVECMESTETTVCAAPSNFQVVFFFFSICIMAIGQGAHKPCVQAFGAYQFDEDDPSKSSFFNWYFFGMGVGATVSFSVVTYVQDNQGWGLGFGIPLISMVSALVILLLGTKIYRHELPSGKIPFDRFAKNLISAARNWKTPSLSTKESRCFDVQEEATEQTQLKVTRISNELDYLENNCNVCTVNHAKETKGILRLFPIWATSLMYLVIFSQSTTFFTKQDATMDRKISSGFQIPAASLQSFIGLSTLILIPIYDRIFVPAARFFTGFPSGITMLQRIGIGMFLSVISMATAATVEMKRLRTAADFGLVDKPTETVPMAAWWLLPQYLLIGVSNVFTMAGLQEFFYDQMPVGLRSLGSALYLSIFGVASFLSGFLISLIEMVTGSRDGDSWFSNNLNGAHLDYFYWLLSVLSALALGLYLFYAKSFVYKRGD